MKKMKIYNSTLDYTLDNNIIKLQELNPKKPFNYGLANIVYNIAEVEKIKLQEYLILFKNKSGVWGHLEIVKHSTKFTSFNEIDYCLAKARLLNCT